jgi:uncharacterized protein HemY
VHRLIGGSRVDWAIVAGSLYLGIGALVGWYFSEAEQIIPRVLGVSISASVGSLVLAMFIFFLIGFVIANALEVTFYNYYGERRSKAARMRSRSGGSAVRTS